MARASRGKRRMFLLDDEGLGVEGERPQQLGGDGVMFGPGLQDQTFISRQLTVLHLLHGPFTCSQRQLACVNHHDRDQYGGLSRTSQLITEDSALTVILCNLFVGILLLGAGHHPAVTNSLVTDTPEDKRMLGNLAAWRQQIHQNNKTCGTKTFWVKELELRRLMRVLTRQVSPDQKTRR